jgi:hypothetical protein
MHEVAFCAPHIEYPSAGGSVLIYDSSQVIEDRLAILLKVRFVFVCSLEVTTHDAFVDASVGPYQPAVTAL